MANMLRLSEEQFEAMQTKASRRELNPNAPRPKKGQSPLPSRALPKPKRGRVSYMERAKDVDDLDRITIEEASPRGFVEVLVPWPPSVNHYWQAVRLKGKHGVRLSDAAMRYKKRVAELSLVAKWPRLRGTFDVTIHAHPPDSKVRDVDNLPKAILDSLTHAGIWRDDSQVSRISVERHSQKSGGLIQIRIRPCAETLPDPRVYR